MSNKTLSMTQKDGIYWSQKLDEHTFETFELACKNSGDIFATNPLENRIGLFNDHLEDFLEPYGIKILMIPEKPDDAHRETLERIIKTLTELYDENDARKMQTFLNILRDLFTGFTCLDLIDEIAETLLGILGDTAEDWINYSIKHS